MPPALTSVRFTLTRLGDLLRRTGVSIRTRGLRATWARIGVHLRPPKGSQRPVLCFPADTPAIPASIPSSPAPVASIVIPVYNQIGHTLACLRALALHPPHTPVEILVVDDGSSDETSRLLPTVNGLVYHRRQINGGFIEAVNDGVARARGEFVVLLNNDTIPQPGWLDALLDTLRSEPAAGLVGSQLLYPDGRLQECGGVLFADGSAWSYGRFESPDLPAVSYLRDAHYCSGAALALRRTLWDSLGGLDTRFRPAYYEDADLAMRVRQAGLRVLVQPASRVVHDEGTSHGTDVRTGLKAHQIRNQAVFARHWSNALATHPAPGTVPGPEVLHAHQPQVLVIDEHLPCPDRDSASLRQVRLLQLLRAEGAHVVLLATAAGADPATVGALRAAGVETWPAPDAGHPNRWLARHGSRFDTVILVRHHLAAACLPLVRRHAPAARVVLDTVDLHHLRELRGARLMGDPARIAEAGRTRERELSTMRKVDLTVLVSADEQKQLQASAPDIQTVVVSNLHILPEPITPLAGRHGLVFVGGFGHPPNVDAMTWYLQQIHPQVLATLPGITLDIVGQSPPASLQALARGLTGVRVHGHVPDITPFMAGCRVALAPLRFGAGVKGKVNLSMAYGQPVVATACAAEGMYLSPGRDVLVADTAEDFASAIVRLCTDDRLWQQLSEGGRENIRRHFSLDAARPTVRQALLPALAAQPTRRTSSTPGKASILPSKVDNCP